MVNNTPVQPAPVRPPRRGAYTAGAVLLVLGGLMLVSELLTRTNPGWWQWPYTITLVGLGLLLLGFLVRTPGNAGLFIPGFIVLNVSAVLLYQNWSGHWESWSYLWPIVAPGGVALGLLLGGLLDGDGKAIRSGLIMLAVSLGLLVGFTLFFQGFIFGGWAWSSWLMQPWVGGALVMVAGAAILIYGLLRR
jgi:hypothetical protein